MQVVVQRLPVLADLTDQHQHERTARQHQPEHPTTACTTHRRSRHFDPPACPLHPRSKLEVTVPGD